MSTSITAGKMPETDVNAGFERGKDTMPAPGRPQHEAPNPQPVEGEIGQNNRLQEEVPALEGTQLSAQTSHGIDKVVLPRAKGDINNWQERKSKRALRKVLGGVAVAGVVLLAAAANPHSSEVNAASPAPAKAVDVFIIDDEVPKNLSLLRWSFNLDTRNSNTVRNTDHGELVGGLAHEAMLKGGAAQKSLNNVDVVGPDGASLQEINEGVGIALQQDAEVVNISFGAEDPVPPTEPTKEYPDTVIGEDGIEVPVVEKNAATAAADLKKHRSLLVEASRRGINTTRSAGNEGREANTMTVKGSLSLAAWNSRQGDLWDYSNYSSQGKVQIAVPVGPGQGTSGAAGKAAGLLGAIRAKHNLTAEGAVNFLIQTADKRDQLIGKVACACVANEDNALSATAVEPVVINIDKYGRKGKLKIAGKGVISKNYDDGEYTYEVLPNSPVYLKVKPRRKKDNVNWKIEGGRRSKKPRIKITTKQLIKEATVGDGELNGRLTIKKPKKRR